MSPRGPKPQPVPRHLLPWDYAAGTGVRALPEWQDAHRDYLTELPGEEPDERFLRRVDAAHRMHVIECAAAGREPMTRTQAAVVTAPPGRAGVDSALAVYLRHRGGEAAADLQTSHPQPARSGGGAASGGGLAVAPVAASP